MTDFYKMDPADWDFGTASLTLEEEAAYLRIVNAIHKHKGPVPDIDRVLAGMFRTSTRKARGLVQALLDAGKITIEGGKIWNDRARSDLVHRGFVSISRAESGAKGGRTRAINAAKALENNNPAQANASSREEKRREETTDTSVSVVTARRAKRGSRLPETWTLPKAWGEWAMSEGWPETIIRAEADKFKDYWIARTGKDATKADWLATWRNWMRNSKTQQKGNQSERRAFDQATAAVAVGLTSGAITLDHSSRDPFAVRSGGHAQADEHGVIPLFRS